MKSKQSGFCLSQGNRVIGISDLKYPRIAAKIGYLNIMLGTERVPDDALNIDMNVENVFVFPGDERKQKHLTRKMNQKGYRDLQLSTSKFAFQLVSLAKTVDLPHGSVAMAWASFKDEYDPSEGEDKIKLLEDFQNNMLLSVKVNITEWLALLSTQMMKLK